MQEIKKRAWRKPEIKQIVAGSAEQPTKTGTPADGSGHSS